jgi:hypothetical protein
VFEANRVPQQGGLVGEHDVEVGADGGQGLDGGVVAVATGAAE